jgi:hypothetical protein
VAARHRPTGRAHLQEVTVSLDASTTAPARSFTLPRGPVLIGGAWLLGVVGPLIFFLGVILFTDRDAFANEGPVDSIVSIAVVGHVATALALGLALGLGRDPRRAPAVSVVLGVLSVVLLVLFWSGAPVVLGACAAWCAGLSRDRRPLPGAARIAGLVGTFVALLSLVIWYVSSFGDLLAG